MATIGIYDSGVGGLSVLREILRLLPHEKYVYYADNAWCPYGDKPSEVVVQRARTITETLIAKGARVIVIACNTATAAAVATLRREYPDTRFIGMEPAIKPAALGTKTGVIGVLATAGTISSSKYLLHKEQMPGGITIVENVGRGFVELVETGRLDGPEAEDTVTESVRPLIKAGADKIVLGCTHYPFLRQLIQKAAGPGVELIDPAPAIARRLKAVLDEEQIETSGLEKAEVELLASGKDDVLRSIFARL